MDPIRAYLSLSKSDINSLAPHDFLIVPKQDSWNDFGYRIRVEIGIKMPDAPDQWIPAYMAIKEEFDTTTYLRKELKQSTYIPIENLGKPFAVLLFENQQYVLLRKLLGVQRAKEALNLLNDVALLSHANKPVPNWDEFIESQVFSHAMTRASESYFAFRRGASILEGISWAEASNSQKSFAVELKGKGPKLKFNFNFDNSNPLRGRIAVIVGKNGFGKTATLSKLASALSGEDENNLSFEEKPEINQVLAFVHSASIDLFKAKNKKNKGKTSAHTRVFAFNPKSERNTSRDGLARLLVDIARTFDNQGQLLGYLRELLKQELPNLGIYVPIKSGSSSNPDYIDSNGREYSSLTNWMGGGEQKKLNAASSVEHSRNLVFLDKNKTQRKLSIGQFAFLQFALNALANAGPASIILIDEPENFLHPNLISQFMRLLNRLLTGTESIAIIATHSPFVVREVQAIQVHVIHEEESTGEPIVSHPRMQTLGANVGDISDNIFGDDLPMHLYEELVSKVDKSFDNFDIFLAKYAKEISTEALMKIRQNWGSS